MHSRIPYITCEVCSFFYLPVVVSILSLGRHILLPNICFFYAHHISGTILSTKIVYYIYGFSRCAPVVICSAMTISSTTRYYDVEQVLTWYISNPMQVMAVYIMLILFLFLFFSVRWRLGSSVNPCHGMLHRDFPTL